MLHLNGLGKRFGDQWILRELNLQVREGECVALLGPSGCGKSTAPRLIAGLERQDEGSIELDGARLDTIPAERRRIAMVFQSYALFPHLSVRENLNLGLKIRGVAHAQRQQRINSVLDTVRLKEMADRRPQQLSGGQRQRIALARAFYHGRNVLVMDEATSALDNKTEEEIVDQIRRLKGQITMIIIAHRHSTVEHCDKIYRLEQGKLVQEGSPQNVLTEFHSSKN